MRSGRLLAEEAPHVLLSIYNCQSLEEVFLKLSRKQQGSESNNLQDVKTNGSSLVSTMPLFPRENFPFFQILVRQKHHYVEFKCAFIIL